MLVTVVSLPFIITQQDSTNQGLVSNPRLLTARERYLTIDVKTSPEDDRVPYLKA